MISVIKHKSIRYCKQTGIPAKSIIKKNKEYYTNIAFTLAEVLITLLIIGVIASLTIPVVTRKIQEAHLKTAFKKGFSVIAQVSDSIIAESGSFAYKCGSYDNNCFVNLFKDRMATLKTCRGNAELEGNCWHADNAWKTLAGANKTISYTTDTGLVLSDGSLLHFRYFENDCKTDFTDLAHNPANSYVLCAEIMIDVNGFDSPNTIGRDIFQINIQEDKADPNGTAKSFWDLNYYPCNTNNLGWSCAVNVMQGN